VSEQFLNSTSAHIRLFSAIHSFIHSVLFTVWQIYIKDGYNQGYLATVKINEKYIRKIIREKNDHKNMSMKDESVRI